AIRQDHRAGGARQPARGRIAGVSDYYTLLDVPRDASENDIKNAYRRVVEQSHPDRNPEAGAEAKFKEITEAYETLCHAEKRAMYDRYGDAEIAGAAGVFDHVDLSEALNIFMRDFGGFESIFGAARSQADSRRGQD